MVQKIDFDMVFDEAAVAYRKAYNDVNPPKFVVGSAKGLGDEIDYSQPVYEMVGLCGLLG